MAIFHLVRSARGLRASWSARSSKEYKDASWQLQAHFSNRWPSLPRLGMTFLGSHLCWKNVLSGVKMCKRADLSSRHWEDYVVYKWIWTRFMKPIVYDGDYLLQSPAQSVNALRWVWSSRCGSNDWPVGRRSKCGEGPRGLSRQEKDPQWRWTGNMLLLSQWNSLPGQLCSVEPLLSWLGLIFAILKTDSIYQLQGLLFSRPIFCATLCCSIQNICSPKAQSTGVYTDFFLQLFFSPVFLWL